MRALFPESRRAMLLGAILASTGRLACGQDTATEAPQPNSNIEAAPGSVAEQIGREVRAVFEKAGSAVVKVEAEDAHGKVCGTGFFIDPSGTLFTSYTIGGEAERCIVHFGEGKLPARKVYADSRAGIAILKVDAATPFLVPAEGPEPEIGSPVVAVGYPMDLPLSPSFGTVAGQDMRYGGLVFATRHLRANVPVQRGQGGAPLLNMRGEIVGILISSLDQGSACFALPIAAAEKVRKDVMCHGEACPGWVGMEVGPGPLKGSFACAEIKKVAPGGPAQKAGLLAGDVIVRVDGRKIATPEDVLNASFFIAPDDEVKLSVERGDATVDVRFFAGTRPRTLSRTQPSTQTVADDTFGSMLPSDLPDLPVDLGE